MGNYTEEDLRKIYNEIRSESFEDAFSKTGLRFKNISPVFGYSSPFSLKIYINIDGINRYNWPEDAVRGLFAHELSHMVSYKRRSFIDRQWFVRFYPFSKSIQRSVEKEADEIAIERGYGRELVQLRKYQLKNSDKKRLENVKKVYLSPETLEKLIEEKNRNEKGENGDLEK